MKLAVHLLHLTFLLVALFSLQSARSANAQSGVELENVQASVHFGEHIVFSAAITPTAAIQDLSIVISEALQGIVHVERVTIGTDGKTEFRFDTIQNALRPFTTVQWHYQFTFQDGSAAQSETYSIRYMDDRFDWQLIESDGLKVNWYEADARFGQAALDAARAGLESIGKILPLDLSQPVEIYIYTTPEDLHGTLSQGSKEWIAGHTDPALSVVMVAIEPGAQQGILMEQRIPHELMHVMLYRRVGAGYRNIPIWLREGMGTLAELQPNSDDERVLGEAVTGDHLIALQELCKSFPSNAAQAFLAYAQSRSFTQYLQDTYGLAGLLNLAAAYADGADCERGPEHVFGVPLSKLETDWRSSIGRQDSFLSMLQALAPYLVLLCLVLVIPLIGIATRFGINKRKS